MGGLNFNREFRAALASKRCQCEEEKKARAGRAAKAAKDAHIPSDPKKGPRTFYSWEGTADNSDIYAATEAFVHGNMEEHILVLVGTFGCGKSHLLEAAGRYYLGQGLRVRYDVVPDLLEEFRATFSDSSAPGIQAWLNWYKAQDLVLLDDLGMEKSTEWGVEKIVQIVDDRLREGRLTIIATNNTEEMMAAQVGPRLTSRLYQANKDLKDVRLVTTGAESWRNRGGA